MQSLGIICGAGIVSGKEIMALELAEVLRSRGRAVKFVTSSWGDGAFKARVQALGLPMYSMRIGFISATLNLECLRMTVDQLMHVPGLWMDYRKFLRLEMPEHIIHTNWHHLLVLFPFLNPHRDWFWLHEVIPEKAQYRRVFGWLGRRLRGFVPVSHAVGESLLRIGIPKEKIQVIHNGIRDPAPGNRPAPRQSNASRIGIVGQVGEWKGHGDLLEAFAQIAGRHPDAELHIFGPSTTSFASALKQRAAELDVASRVIWHGFVVERHEIYRHLDICVVPSRFEEPFGLVAVEAGMFGLPVVACRRGGLPEIIEDSVTGFLVDALNIKALAARLDELLSNPELCRQMGAAGRRHVETHFNLERFAGEFIDLLNAPPISRST